MSWVMCGQEAFAVEVEDEKEVAVKPTKAELALIDQLLYGGKLAKCVKRINELLRWQPQARFAVRNCQREIAKLTQ